MRPKYHISPEHGFLNDPNGLAWFRGKYHVFYQWLPEVVPQGKKQWRHCISDDLVHWTDAGSELKPLCWYEKDGCYSGSGITAGDRYYLFYTGNVRDSDGGRETYQCMAISEDGNVFRKEGPVVYLPEGYTAHFRDPKVWRKNGRWWMAVGAQTREKKGNIALFESEDLKQWDYRGSILDRSMDWGYMCECPDLIEIDGQELLIVSRQKEDGCRGMVFLGRMDYEKAKFQTEGTGYLLDEGTDFYAPQSFEDGSGRRLLFGWLGAGELEYQMSQPSVKQGWLHSLTIPRELFLHNQKLCQRPAKELEILRKEEQSIEESGIISIDRNSTSVELLADQIGGQSVFMSFGTVLKLQFTKEDSTLTISRKRWNTEGYDEIQTQLLTLEDAHIFLDQSTAEIFFNDGERVFTLKAFFGEDMKIDIKSEKKLRVRTWVLEG